MMEAGEFDGQDVLVCHQCDKMFYSNGTQLSQKEVDELHVQREKKRIAYEVKHDRPPTPCRR